MSPLSFTARSASRPPAAGSRSGPIAPIRALLAEGVVALFLLLGMLGCIFATVPGYLTQSTGGDYPYYVEIARHPLANSVPSPWRYRLLNPWLASQLMAAGVGTDEAFLTLTFTFALVSCVLMRLYLTQLGVSAPGARAGALLFAVSVGAWVPLRRYYGYTDALTNALTLGVLVLAQSGRAMATAVTLAIGTVAKESLLLLLPFVALQLFVRRLAWIAIAAVAVAPVLVYVAIHAIVPADASGSAPVALTWAAQVDYWRTAMVHGATRWILWAFAYSMGPVWLLAAVAVPRNWPFVRGSLLLLLPILVPLIRTTDSERALMLTFPVVIPLAAAALETWRGSPYATPIATLAIACTWLAQLTFDWADPMRLGPVNAKDIVFLTLCLAPLLPWRRRKEQTI